MPHPLGAPPTAPASAPMRLTFREPSRSSGSSAAESRRSAASRASQVPVPCRLERPIGGYCSSLPRAGPYACAPDACAARGWRKTDGGGPWHGPGLVHSCANLGTTPSRKPVNMHACTGTVPVILRPRTQRLAKSRAAFVGHAVTQSATHRLVPPARRAAVCVSRNTAEARLAPLDDPPHRAPPPPRLPVVEHTPLALSLVRELAAAPGLLPGSITVCTHHNQANMPPGAGSARSGASPAKYSVYSFSLHSSAGGPALVAVFAANSIAIACSGPAWPGITAGVGSKSTRTRISALEEQLRCEKEDRARAEKQLQ
eukprot:gene3425-3900_t